MVLRFPLPFPPLNINVIILSLAIDLLEKMLVFDPQTRIDCIGSLEHKYLAEYHDLAYEPIAERFDWAFSDAILSVGTWKATIRTEIAGASHAPLCVSTF
jgi:serine/threonine protein kinase